MQLIQNRKVIINDRQKLENYKENKVTQNQQQMQPRALKIRPQISLPKLTLNELLQYPQLQLRINNQKYELTGIHNLIVQLKKQTINHLKQQFICNNNTINPHQFLWLISNSILLKSASYSSEPLPQQYYQYQYQIQYQIVKVFQDIDVDNSNWISWQEYIQYITSSSLIQINEGIRQVKYKDRDREDGDGSVVRELAFSHKEKVLFRKNSIGKIVQVQKLGVLALVQKKLGGLSFLAIGGKGRGDRGEKPFVLSGVDHDKVLSIDYSEEERMFGVLMCSHSVIFVEDSEMPKVIVDNRFIGNQVQIMYLKKHRMWLLISLDGSLQIFTPQKSRKKLQPTKPAPVLKFKPHNDQLIGIHQLHNPMSIVSGSWNNSIKIWSLSINQLLVDINPGKEDIAQQSKSIKGFQIFNNKNISYMICWMFAPEISVWLPSSSLTKPYLGKLVGHMGIVQEAKFLANFPVVISIDNKASVRVWDLAKMQCIQTWKLQSSAGLRLMSLKSAPYVLFYDKLIQFYRSSKETGLIQYNNQVKSTMNYFHSISEQPQNQVQKSQPQTKRTIEQNQSSHKQLQKKQDSDRKQKQPELQQVVLAKTQQKSNIIIATLYDNYLDVFIVLTPEVVSILAVNTGNLICKAYIENKNQNFVAICLKDNRRFFVANTAGEILFFKTQDCSVQYKIYPFKESIERDREKAKIIQQTSNQNAKQALQQTIFAMDFNTHNKVLLVIGQSQTTTVLVTFDNFTEFQPMKKKQMILSQQNLCCFASAQKYNMFYIASNKPQTITIWDYHNFVILRSISQNHHIYHISSFTDYFNCLTIVDRDAVRIVEVGVIENKNNTRSAEIDLFLKEIYIKNTKKVKKVFIHYQNTQSVEKARKGKVTFENDFQMEEDRKIEYKDKKFQIFALSDSTIMLYIIQQLQTCFNPHPQAPHTQKPNITKQLKYFTIHPTPCIPQSISQQIQSNSILKVNISGSRRNINILGYCNKIVYFESDEGVLNFYKPDEGRVWGKISIPKCDVIQWNVFQNLVEKVLVRLRKTEKISKETYAFKRKGVEDQHKKQYLRMCFLLNKYFCQDDLAEMRKYFLEAKQNKKNKQQKKTITQDIKLRAFQQQSEAGQQKKSYFQQKFQQRYFNTAQAAQKIKSLQTMYSKVFNYIKIKRNEKQQQKITQAEGQVLKSRCMSANKLQKGSSTIQRNQSSSAFKIRDTVSSVNKMYFEHTKEIKNCLNKIGILNNKIKGLKL